MSTIFGKITKANITTGGITQDSVSLGKVTQGQITHNMNTNENITKGKHMDWSKWKLKDRENATKTWFTVKQRMFRAIFYPKYIFFYTDNVRASVTNSMSG